MYGFKCQCTSGWLGDTCDIGITLWHKKERLNSSFYILLLHCLYFHTSLLYVTSIIENVVAPVDCEWNEWQMGGCSKTCGGGTRSHIRTKKVKEMYGGICEGESTVSESCFTQDCPGSI